jgi:hypothetical protein
MAIPLLNEAMLLFPCGGYSQQLFAWQHRYNDNLATRISVVNSYFNFIFCISYCLKTIF